MPCTGCFGRGFGEGVIPGYELNTKVDWVNESFLAQSPTDLQSAGRVFTRSRQMWWSPLT
jgi:hypothetical protein